MKARTLGLLMCALVLAAPAAFAQEAKHEHEAPKIVPVGEEARGMQACAGEWDAVAKMWHGPGEPKVARGKQTCKVILGGLAIAYEFESTDEVMPMKGFGVSMWNPTTKKFDAVWFDNYSWNGPALSEGTFDKATKTLTETMVSKMPDGSAMKMRLVTKYESPDKNVMTFYAPGPDGKEVRMMEITYTRAKK